MFWTIVIVIIVLALLMSDPVVWILLVAAGALLLINWLFDIAILVTLAKLCAVGIILKVAYNLIAGVILGD